MPLETFFGRILETLFSQIEWRQGLNWLLPTVQPGNIAKISCKSISFKDMTHQSQVAQAESMRTGIFHFTTLKYNKQRSINEKCT